MALQNHVSLGMGRDLLPNVQHNKARYHQLAKAERMSGANMTDQDILDKLEDLPEDELLTILVLLEAGGESEKGQVAVAWTVLNRVGRGKKYYGSQGGIRGVILQPKQYSCLNRGTSSLRKSLSIPSSKGWPKVHSIVQNVLLGEVEDPTNGATHYFNPAICGIPGWASEMSPRGIIGQHHFYREE